MKVVAIVRRVLREGVSYEEFRRAWFHRQGFGTGNQMLTLINAENPREVIVIAITDTETVTPLELLRADRAERSEHPLDEVIEVDVFRTFGVLVAEDDFSAGSSLTYQPASVDGEVTDLSEVLESISSGQLLVQLAGRPNEAVQEP